MSKAQTLQQRADILFNKFYDITCNVLDTKECCYVFIEEVIEEQGSSPDRVHFWREVKRCIKEK